MNRFHLILHMCNTLHVIVQLSCGVCCFFVVFFNDSMSNTNYLNKIPDSIHRPTCRVPKLFPRSLQDSTVLMSRCIDLTVSA